MLKVRAGVSLPSRQQVLERVGSISSECDLENTGVNLDASLVLVGT